MSHLFSDPYFYLVIAILVFLRNFFGAFPEPDTSLKTGFGSNSPGYRMMYQFARGMTLDLKTVGIDAKSMGLKLKSGPEAQTQIPAEDK